jgi:hypothetical protein
MQKVSLLEGDHGERNGVNSSSMPPGRARARTCTGSGPALAKVWAVLRHAALVLLDGVCEHAMALAAASSRGIISLVQAAKHLAIPSPLTI